MLDKALTTIIGAAIAKNTDRKRILALSVINHIAHKHSQGIEQVKAIMAFAIATIMVPTVQVLARFIREALYRVFWDNELLVPTLLAVITTVTMGRSIAHILQTRYVPKSQRFKAWWHRSVTQMVGSGLN